MKLFPYAFLVLPLLPVRSIFLLKPFNLSSSTSLYFSVSFSIFICWVLFFFRVYFVFGFLGFVLHAILHVFWYLFYLGFVYFWFFRYKEHWFFMKPRIWTITIFLDLKMDGQDWVLRSKFLPFCWFCGFFVLVIVVVGVFLWDGKYFWRG